jgi:hypothetical protein
MTEDVFQLPFPPTFTDEQFSKARSEQYFYPIVFELYKHVAIMGITCAQIRHDSPDFRQFPARHYAILIGLLNRICRLMLSSMALTHEGRYGETMRLLNRCIVESVVNILWLCKQNDPSLFQRFLADGTKSEVELLDIILNNISQRDGQTLVIEDRMLRSIRRFIDSTGLSSEEIMATPKLPNFKDRLSSLDFNNQAYLAIQKMGSHAIHGTWPDLLRFYLDWDEGDKFLPKDLDSRPHAYDYIHVSSFVIDAMRCFLNYISESKYNLDEWLPQIKLTSDLLTKVENLRSEGDLESTQDVN